MKRLVLLLLAFLLAGGSLSILLFLALEGKKAYLRPAELLSSNTLLLYAEEQSSSPSDLLPRAPEVLQQFLTEERAGALYGSGDALTILTFQRIRSRKDLRSVSALLSTQKLPARIIGSYLVFGEETGFLKIVEPQSVEALSEHPHYVTLFRALPREAEKRFLLRGDGQMRTTFLPPHPLLQTLLKGAGDTAFALTMRERVLDATIVRLGSSGTEHVPALSLPPDDPFQALLLAVAGSNLQNDLESGIRYLASDIPGRDLVLRGALDAAFHRFFSPDANMHSILTQTDSIPYALFLRSGSGGNLTFGLMVQDATGDFGEMFSTLLQTFARHFPRAQVRSRTFPPGRVVRDIIADASLVKEEEWVEQGFAIRSILSEETQEELLFAQEITGTMVILASDRALLLSLLQAGVPPRGTRVLRQIVLSGRSLQPLSPLLKDAPSYQILRETLGEEGILRWKENEAQGLVRTEFTLEGVENGTHIP